MNLPNGTTTRDINNLCRPDDSSPRQEVCSLCPRVIEQDPSTKRWFDSDDVFAFGMEYMLDRHNALDAFQIPGGWCCGTICWNDHCAEPLELGPCAVVALAAGLHLVKGGRA